MLVVIPEVSHFLLMMALVLSFGQAVAVFAPTSGAVVRGQRVMATGLTAVLALSFLGLIWSFVTSDFSVRAVAENSHTAKPFLYKIAAAWGHHEGSLVLWVLILALFGWWVSRLRASDRFMQVTMGVQGALILAFVALIVFTSNPFLRLDPVPLQGASLNPLLQDPSLALHPPMLYVGYVGFSVVFALAVAALVTGRADADWARLVRPVSLVAWSFLTLGIGLGSYWAYYELGWGGWWFWDPVENASLLPWLSGTALIHSLIVLQKRGLFAAWAVFLGIISFCLSILGTFLVRSGVLTSVHAFAMDPLRGYAVLLIFLLFAGGAFALYAVRAHRLSTGVEAPEFTMTSREGMMTINTVVLAVLTLTVLVGTLYPLLLEGLTGQSISVGPPYYNQVFTPISALLLLMLPVGSVMAWRHVGERPKRLWVPAVVVMLCGVLLTLWLGVAHLWPIAGLVLGGWVVLCSVIDLWQRPVRTVGVWGMALAHIGVGLLAVAAVAETAFRDDITRPLAIGESLEIGPTQLTLRRVGEVDGENYVAMRGQVEATLRNGKQQTFWPERRYFPASAQTTTEAAIRTTPLGDLYVTIAEPKMRDGEAVWPVRVARHPMIPALYLGMLLMALGGGLAAYQTYRRRGA